MNTFCLNEVAQWILTQGFTKVGLEFADEPIKCVEISKLLKEKLGFNPYILYDRNRACGNCCVDVRTARPRGIQAIVHFGSTCLTPSESFPILYVLSSPISFDAQRILQELLSGRGPEKENKLVLTYDILCTPFIESTYELLKKHFPNLILSFPSTLHQHTKIIYSTSAKDSIKLNASVDTDESGNVFTINSRIIALPHQENINQYDFIYIGKESPFLVSLQMRFSDRNFYVFDLANNSLSVSNFTKFVMKRSSKLEQIKAAKTIGIVNSLLPGHKEISERLKNIIKASGKRCYSFFIGKINEAKLGNIVGIDIFVYIGCPESSLFDRNEQRYLYQNIVTPWEIEVALNSKTEWNLNFELDFRKLLLEDLNNEGQSTDVGNSKLESLENCRQQSTALLSRNPGTLSSLHQNAAGEIFSKLSWKGLDPAEESAVPTGTIVQGKKGIAIAYDEEGN